MTWTIQQLIKNPTKKPIRRLYIKRITTAGTYESNWVRVDTLNSINRITDWGKVTYSIDAEQYIVNAWDISTCEITVTNADGKFNSSADFRSLWYYTQDFKDTKIKIVVAMEDPDGNEVGTVDAFEGVIVLVENTADNQAKIVMADYTKKLADYSFPDLGISGSQTASTILAAILADSKVAQYFATSTLTPVNNTTVDTSDEVFKKSYFDVIKYLAQLTCSTLIARGTDFKFISRTTTATSADWTFRGVGNTSDDRMIDLYEQIVFDQAGTDKLYTRIVDSSTSGYAVASTNPDLLRIGKTKTVDLTRVATGGKTAVLNAYLAYFGHKRPTIKLPSTIFMMMLLFPFDIIAVDNPGAQTEALAVTYDAAEYDGGGVYDGDGGASSVWKSALFVIESIEYNFNDWDCALFCRQQI